jgi:hypothetical protein
MRVISREVDTKNPTRAGEKFALWQILLDIQDRIRYPSLMQKQVLIRQVLVNLGLIQDGGIVRYARHTFADKELSA